MRNLSIFIFIIFYLPFTLKGQNQITISGKVTDNYNIGIPGTSIIEDKTTNGTITDHEGNYVLNVSDRNATIQVSFIGYKTQTIPVNGRTVINISLQEDVEQLNEIVITGYGGQQKRATLTTAISKLDNSVLKNAALGNVGQSLQGTISGLRVVNMSGQPGSEPNIVLRGGATISGENNEALVVVDGIVRSSLADINSSDIESIQVLKDAASTAIYGARANGGVILVTTKRGKEGKAQVNYKLKTGLNFLREGYKFVNAHDYIYYNRLGWKRTGKVGIDGRPGYGVGNELYDIRYLTDKTAYLLNEGWMQMTDPYDESQQILYKDHSGILEKEAFNNPSFTQDHYIDISGGNDKSTFVASLGYYNEDGLVKGTNYERFSGNIQGSYKVFPWLKVNAGSTYTWSKQPSLYVDDVSQFFYRTLAYRPTWNPFLEDGSPAPGLSITDGNPLYYLERLTNTNGTRRSTYTIGADISIIPNMLTLNYSSSLYHIDFQDEDFNKSYQTQDSATPNQTRAARAKYEKQSQQQHNVTLTYTDSFWDKHNLEIMLGGECFDWHEFTMEAKTENSPLDDIPTLNVGSVRTYTSTIKQGYRILSGFGRINYNYKYKYLFSIVSRMDGISKLSDNRWGFFPGVSFGWNLTEESFFKNSKMSKYVSNIKPRFSYGVNGNVNGLGNYDVYGNYAQTDNYGGSVGFYNEILVNNKLRWEQSKSFEVGLDVGFLNNRLTFILDYYRRTTTDLLADLSLPDYTGFKSLKTNLGTLRNQGFEMEVKAVIANRGRFKWEMSGNLSTVSNKIIKLPYNGNENNRQGGYQIYDPKQGKLIWAGGLQEGHSIGDMFGYKQDHIFVDWDDVRKHADNRYDAIAELYGPAAWEKLENKTGKRQIEPGDVCWADMNNDGIINGYDRVKVGNMYPTVTGGFSTTFTYKDFSLYGRFDYALGHTIYNDLRARLLGQFQGTFNLPEEVKDMWDEDNKSSDLPRFYQADQSCKKNIARNNASSTGVDNNSSRFYEKGDYLALREVTITWNLPKKWLEKVFIKNASLSITGQNLFYITGYTGTSPEPVIDPAGFDNGRYPTPKTVLLGFSLTL